MTRDLAALADQLITIAKKAGADAADAIVVDGTSISIEVRGGALENAERSEGIDLGLRAFVGQRQACVSSSDARPETLETMAERAIAMAREAPEDPHAGLADPAQLATDRDYTPLELYDPTPEPDPATLQDTALQAEAAARAVDGVTQVQCSTGYSRRRFYLAASNGFVGGYDRTSHGLTCEAITGSGTEMERDFDYDSRIFQADTRSPTDIGRTAAERAVARAGSRRPKTGQYPVLFDERIASSLVSHLLGAVNGATIARGSSWLLDALDEQVLPAGMSLHENPHRKRSGASRLFDAEGLATKPRTIVGNGILKGWTLDLGTARKLGLESTASASRGTSSTPSPSLSNVVLTPGDQSREDLLKEMGTGLMITSLIGSTINPITGDYSRGASGFWVENGEITYPVNECTVAGNLREMLLGMKAANDAREYLRLVVPSLLVEGLTLAGD